MVAHRVTHGNTTCYKGGDIQGYTTCYKGGYTQGYTIFYKGVGIQGNNILVGLEEEQYAKVVDMLEKAILATDLALYFQ